MGNYQTQELMSALPPERQPSQLILRGRLKSHEDYCQHINGDDDDTLLTDLHYSIPDTISLYKKMDASFNAITDIPDELPLKLPHLSFLDISHNRISNLPNSFALLVHLETLIIRHNLLRRLPETFVQLSKLVKVDLSNNAISQLPNDIGSMVSLTKVNVSNNKLKILPVSLGNCSTLTLLLASGNRLEIPPQEICDEGSNSTIFHIRKQYISDHRDLTPPIAELYFPRIRGNQLASSVPNYHSAQMEYIQAQTHTTHLSSRIKTPLLPPVGVTELDPDELCDRIAGLVYGAAIGDAIGIATRWMTKDESHFYYERDQLCYSVIVQDEHRSCWERGDWTSNFDQMLVVLESLIAWAGVVDELDFAKRLKDWFNSGIPELNRYQAMVSSQMLHKVLEDPAYVQDPHGTAVKIWSLFSLTDISSKGDGCSCPRDHLSTTICPQEEQRKDDNTAVVRTPVLGVPFFHDLSEVSSNAVRICRASHDDSQCIAACVATAVIIALLLQGRHKLNRTESLESILNIVTHHANNYLENEDQKRLLRSYLKLNNLSSLQTREKGKMTHTFKPVGAAVLAMKTSKHYRDFITDLVLEAGDSNSNCCVGGAVMGCKVGYHNLPRDWIHQLKEPQLQCLKTKVNHLLDMIGLP